jgi:nucleoside-diphosphate-sugar epimerase
LKQFRLNRLQSLPSFAFHRVDIADRRAVDEQFDRVVRDAGAAQPAAAVFHLAARAGVRPSVDDPWAYVEANLVGALNLLECCRRHRVPKFVLASTSSLYGAHHAVPFSEAADTDRPLSPYAASKKAAEAMAFSYHHLHGLDVSVLRYFTVYGPAGRPDMSVFRFVRRIAEREAIVLFGDGSQERDFTYVDDIARGTIAARRPLGYEVINLGSDRPAKLGEVIALIGKELGQAPRIERQPSHPADVPATWADIGKARRLLDWRPNVALEDGIARTVAWYREHRELCLAVELGDRR